MSDAVAYTYKISEHKDYSSDIQAMANDGYILYKVVTCKKANIEVLYFVLDRNLDPPQ